MRNGIFLIIAGLFGLLAVAWVLFQGGAGDSSNRTIVVAAESIAPGESITDAQVRKVVWGLPDLPIGGFSEFPGLVGRVALTEIGVGQPILEAALAPANSSGGLAAIIGPGRRAIAIQSDEVSGVAGFVVPGSFVDVLVGGRDATGSSFSKILLQRVRVLAVEQATQADPAEPRVVRALTLELAPEQAELIDLGRSLGRLSIVLRNNLDFSSVVTSGAVIGDILPSLVPAAVAEPVGASEAQAQSPARPSPPAARTPDRSVTGIEEFRGTAGGAR